MLSKRSLTIEDLFEDLLDYISKNRCEVAINMSGSYEISKRVKETPRKVTSYTNPYHPSLNELGEIHINILMVLRDATGMRHKQIARMVGRKIVTPELWELRERNLIVYNKEERRYSITNEGRSYLDRRSYLQDIKQFGPRRAI
jgi:DNA-binding HxlR family transcriptional regulator